jgi:nucleoside-diphosphate-sugar epimerase
MLKTDRILLTGITGAVGSWIAREALERGCSILALVRDKKDSAAREKTAGVLKTVGAEKYVNNVDLIRGNIGVDGLGIHNARSKLSGICAIFHCAASTKFDESIPGLSRLMNVQGTANVLKLAGRLDVPICYISTAYVAGRRQGIVKESETDIGQDFNNVYERTKCRAEVLVRKWADETGLPATIFRPSIVFGDSVEGRIARFNGVYNLLRFLDHIAPTIGGREIRAVAKADATKNFVPVDYLARAIWHIVESGAADTYHITNPKPIRLTQLRDIFSELFGINGKLVEQNDFKRRKATRVELLYQKASSLYLPYMTAEPVFDRSNTDGILIKTHLAMPAMDTAYFARLVEYGRLVKWGKLQAG